jgi:tetratricopeptide (TPR) repeat protein
VPKAAFTAGFTAREVAGLLGLPVGQVRSYVRDGLVTPRQGPRGEHRFALPDVVLLRTAKGLADQISPAKLRRALRRLKDQLPPDRPLSAMRITVEGDQVIVRDGSNAWRLESGQRVLDFEVAELSSKVAPLVRRAARLARETPDQLQADDWFELGYELELTEPEQARDSYRRALELQPDHVPARVNLGRLLHEKGQVKLAETHYRMALSLEPANATALFNLGVALEDLGRLDAAALSYELVVRGEPKHADAHFNLARLYERLGKKALAIRHLKAYQSIRSSG